MQFGFENIASNFHRLMGDAYTQSVRAFMMQIIPRSFVQNEETINKIGKLVASTQEYEELGRLFVAVYEAGFLKAIEQHKDLLERHGLRAEIIEAEPKSKLNLG